MVATKLRKIEKAVMSCEEGRKTYIQAQCCQCCIYYISENHWGQIGCQLFVCIYIPIDNVQSRNFHKIKLSITSKDANERCSDRKNDESTKCQFICSQNLALKKIHFPILNWMSLQRLKQGFK
jgi:hypothetical protein